MATLYQVSYGPPRTFETSRALSLRRGLVPRSLRSWRTGGRSRLPGLSSLSPAPPPASALGCRLPLDRPGGADPRCGRSFLALGRSRTAPVLTLRLQRRRLVVHRSVVASIPLVRHFDRDAVLLRILGYSPLRLQIADELLQGLPVRWSRQRCRPLLRKGPHQVFRKQRRGGLLGSSASVSAAAARTRPIRRFAPGCWLLLPFWLFRRGSLRLIASTSSTSPPPRRAHLVPPRCLRRARPGHRPTTAPGRSSRALQVEKHGQRSRRNPAVPIDPHAFLRA
jgi:hypothetical protein